MRLLARALFHQLRDVHGVPDDRGVLLEVAALLHDVGEVVNQRGHHKHSEYMIRWGRIPGLDDTGREMVALMARCHRKDAGARQGRSSTSSPLPKEQRGQLRKLTALLRLADSLDTEHRSRVEQVVCTRMGDAIVLDLVVRDGPSRDDAQLLRKADLLKDELGLDVRVTVARPVATPPPIEAGASGGMQAARAKMRWTIAVQIVDTAMVGRALGSRPSSRVRAMRRTRRRARRAASRRRARASSAASRAAATSATAAASPMRAPTGRTTTAVLAMGPASSRCA